MRKYRGAHNPYDDEWKGRLGGAVSASLHLLKPFREHRLAAMREFVGYHYSDDGAADRVPVNYISMAVMILQRQLAASAPRALVISARDKLRAQAANLEVALNDIIAEIDLANTIRECLIDSLFSIGVAKIGLRSARTIKIDGQIYDVGSPFAEPVDLDDLILDMSARSFRERSFVGNRYRASLDYVRNSEVFDKQARKEVQATERSIFNSGGDERAESLSIGTSYYQNETFTDSVELCDIWIPDANFVVTYQSDSESSEGDAFFGPCLRVVDWNGPPQGPYRYLFYSSVPHNVMPKPPIADLMDNHELANRLWRKLGRQAERQKTLFGYMSGTEEDANRILNAKDGEMIRLDNPDKMKELQTGGIFQPNLAFAVHAGETIKQQGGNLDLLGGLGPQSPTLGQDQMLAQSANKLIAHMQDRVIDFATGCIKDLAFYAWTDPLLDREITRVIPGTDLRVRSRLRAQQLRGKFSDHEIRIEPYSMMHKSPGMRLQTIRQFITEFVMPLAPALMAQGIKIDFQAIAKIWGRYTDMVELTEILKMPSQYELSMPMGEGGEMPYLERMPQSPVTHRVNERVNRPGATIAGKDDVLKRILLAGDRGGQGAQGAEIDSLLRASM